MKDSSGNWIKLNRCLIQSLCFKNSELLHVWIYLLLDVNHSEGKVMIGNQMVVINPGQTLTSRKKISEMTGIQESKVERLLNILKTEQQIEQQSFTKYRIISIVNWDMYQRDEQQIEQQMNSKRTANEQQMNTNKNEKKKEEKIKDIIPFPEIISYLNQKTGKNYRIVDTHKKHISARWNDGYRLDDFKTVIDKKTSEWLDDPQFSKFLAPDTLFGNKFDKYLNQGFKDTAMRGVK